MLRIKFRQQYRLWENLHLPSIVNIYGTIAPNHLPIWAVEKHGTETGISFDHEYDS